MLGNMSAKLYFVIQRNLHHKKGKERRNLLLLLMLNLNV